MCATFIAVAYLGWSSFVRLLRDAFIGGLSNYHAIYSLMI